MKAPSAELTQQPAIQSTPETAPRASAQSDLHLSPQMVRQILISLMFPSMIMPITSSMSKVALPVMRSQFQIPADTTAWINTAFTLPFMILMPVYGRLSDGVGKRRLILAGLLIFSAGTAITLASTNLAWLMVGRAVQGLGGAGMMPLAMAFLSAIFHAEERGKALGTWSTVGPTTAFIGPLVAGFLVEMGGWRTAYVLPLIAGLVAFVVVMRFVPGGLSRVRPRFWRQPCLY